MPNITEPFPDDFLPTASLPILKFRAHLLRTIREFFDTNGYWEVETPILSHDIVVDAHLDPFVARSANGDELYLQTSPEFGMKRLIAAGADAIYQITRAMRQGESGSLHNPEFTIVEWYRVGDTHHDQMDFVELLVRSVFEQATGYAESPPQASALSTSVAQPPTQKPFNRLTYDAAFERETGTTVLNLSARQLADLADSHNITAPDTIAVGDRDGWLNLLLAELVEPRLGQQHPEFLFNYPASQAALACIPPDNPTIAERFELYLGGMEICNGYHELTDAGELRRRMQQQAELREANRARELPQQNRLLDAMQAGLPACAGVALGFDRLMMLATNANSINDVIAFPFDRA